MNTLSISSKIIVDGWSGEGLKDNVKEKKVEGFVEDRREWKKLIERAKAHPRL